MINRRSIDWPTSLAFYVQSRRHMPFVWGENDCCLFTANSIKAITGSDIAEEFRGSYSSKEEAVEFVEQNGGLEDFVAGVFAHHGIVEGTVNFAQRGDPVIIDMPVGSVFPIALGVCGGQMSMFPGPNGIVSHPTANCRRTWRIL